MQYGYYGSLIEMNYKNNLYNCDSISTRFKCNYCKKKLKEYEKQSAWLKAKKG